MKLTCLGENLPESSVKLTLALHHCLLRYLRLLHYLPEFRSMMNFPTSNPPSVLTILRFLHGSNRFPHRLAYHRNRRRRRYSPSPVDRFLLRTLFLLLPSPYLQITRSGLSYRFGRVHGLKIFTSKFLSQQLLGRIIKSNQRLIE